MTRDTYFLVSIVLPDIIYICIYVYVCISIVFFCDCLIGLSFDCFHGFRFEIVSYCIRLLLLIYVKNKIRGVFSYRKHKVPSFLIFEYTKWHGSKKVPPTQAQPHKTCRKLPVKICTKPYRKLIYHIL